jgi:hypothetical protein
MMLNKHATMKKATIYVTITWIVSRKSFFLFFNSDFFSYLKESKKQEPKSRLRQFDVSVKKHIEYIAERLDSCYPDEEKLHCFQPDEREYRFKPVVRKTVTVGKCKNERGKCLKNYEFDETTDELADPKLNIMMASCKTYQEFLQRNLNDVGFTDALKSKVAQKNGDVEGIENPRKIPSEKQKKILNEMKFAEARKKEYEDLVSRVERLCTHIQKKMEKLEKLQVINVSSKLKENSSIKFLYFTTVTSIRTRLVLLSPSHCLSFAARN